MYFAFDGSNEDASQLFAVIKINKWLWISWVGFWLPLRVRKCAVKIMH